RGLQRPGGRVGVGGRPLASPVLPGTIVYAPPGGSLGNSVATYTQGQTVGTTVTTSFGEDTSKTVPNLSTDYGQAQVFKGFLDTIAQALALAKATEKAGQVVGDISAQLGQFTSSVQTGFSD